MSNGRISVAAVLGGISLVLAAACSSSGSSTGAGGAAGSSASGGAGGSGAAGGSGGAGGVDCQCGKAAYLPVCGIDGKTYDAACGAQCVPVAVACQGECPCADAGAASCGDVGFCMVGFTCVEEVFEPTCQSLSDPNADCPAGQTKTLCGGAGGACCCDPPPASKFACQDVSSCTGAIDCSCVTCPSGKQCMPVGSSTSGLFRCEDPPKP